MQYNPNIRLTANLKFHAIALRELVIFESAALNKIQKDNSKVLALIKNSSTKLQEKIRLGRN